MGDLGRKRGKRVVEELSPSNLLHSKGYLANWIAVVLEEREVGGRGEEGEEEVAIFVHGG